MPEVRHPDRPGLHVRVELLERIRDDGSISAAGRGMEKSYRRAWDLVEAIAFGSKWSSLCFSHGSDEPKAQ